MDVCMKNIPISFWWGQFWVYLLYEQQYDNNESIVRGEIPVSFDADVTKSYASVYKSLVSRAVCLGLRPV